MTYRQKIKIFLSNNRWSLSGVITGLITGYLYWNVWGYEWGSYPFSASLWLHMLYGGLTGGFLTTMAVK